MRKFDPPPTKFGAVATANVSQAKPGTAGVKSPPGVAAAPAARPPTPVAAIAKPVVGAVAVPPSSVSPVQTVQAKPGALGAVPTGGGAGSRPAGAATVQMMDRHPQWDKHNKKDPLFRQPRATSPLRGGQQDVLNNLRVEMNRQSVSTGKWRPQPIETVKGRIGEMEAAVEYKADGLNVVDVNEEMWKNFPAFDHVTSDRKFPFSQSKIHIGDGDFYLDEKKKKKAEKEARLKKLARDYEGEIEARYEMAALFLKKITGSSKKLGSLDALALKLKNPTFTSILKEINDLDGDEDFDETHAVCKRVGDAIRFPVPLDVYPYLKKKYQHHAYMLKHPTSWFASTLRKSYHMETKKKLSKEQKALKDDPDY